MSDHVVHGVPAELRTPPVPPTTPGSPGAAPGELRASPDDDSTGQAAEDATAGADSGPDSGPGSGPGSMAAPIVDEEVGDPEQVNARCPYCGAPVSSAESFCEACGSDLVTRQLNPLDLAPAPTTGGLSTDPATDPVTGPATDPTNDPTNDPAAVGPIPRSWLPDLAPSPGAVSADDLDLLDLGPGESAEVTRRRPAPGGAAVEPAFGPITRECAECGGRVGDDLYCEQCGTKAPSQRDHFTEAPAAWVAGVCDRGIRHHRNEDALALWAQGESGAGAVGRAVLIVCDGVSTSTDSDLASLAAARAARNVLVAARPAGLGIESSRTAVLTKSMTVAAVEANAAVVRSSAGRPGATENPASCTYAVGVVDVTVEGTRISYANIGDSRVYWLPDGDEPVMLSVDDSVAQVRIAMGVPRDQAEISPQAHAITRWLGPDAPDLKPTTGSLAVTGSGWLMVCSDGLWNYASEPSELARLVADAIVDDTANAQPPGLAAALTQWANDQGGKDNITVALARVGEPVVVSSPPPAESADETPRPHSVQPDPERLDPEKSDPEKSDPDQADPDQPSPDQEATMDQERRHG